MAKVVLIQGCVDDGPSRFVSGAAHFYLCIRTAERKSPSFHTSRIMGALLAMGGLGWRGTSPADWWPRFFVNRPFSRLYGWHVCQLENAFRATSFQDASLLTALPKKPSFTVSPQTSEGVLFSAAPSGGLFRSNQCPEYLVSRKRMLRRGFAPRMFDYSPVRTSR